MAKQRVTRIVKAIAKDGQMGKRVLQAKLDAAIKEADEIGERLLEVQRTASSLQRILSAPTTIRLRFALGSRVWVVDKEAQGTKGTAAVVTGFALNATGRMYSVRHSAESDDVLATEATLQRRDENPAFAIPGEWEVIKLFPLADSGCLQRATTAAEDAGAEE